jgi:hypothetical protein
MQREDRPRNEDVWRQAENGVPKPQNDQQTLEAVSSKCGLSLTPPQTPHPPPDRKRLLISDFWPLEW